jgi:hypothetical protein
MNTKVISQGALDMIEQYKNVPYFNNKTQAKRVSLKVNVGKGSPKEIFDEIKELAILNKIDIKSFNDEGLRKFMVLNNIGIDCSGFAFYVLNEESIKRDKGSLSRKMHLNGFISRFNPEKNTDVKVFADDRNSHVVSLKEIQVGDIITMIAERNHILVIYQIEYQNFIPTTLHYAHAIAWPTDGEFGHGLHKGIIEIINPEKDLFEQRWIELGKDSLVNGDENYTFSRARKSKTEIRRLNWF